MDHTAGPRHQPSAGPRHQSTAGPRHQSTAGPRHQSTAGPRTHWDSATPRLWLHQCLVSRTGRSASRRANSAETVGREVRAVGGTHNQDQVPSADQLPALTVKGPRASRPRPRGQTSEFSFHSALSLGSTEITDEEIKSHTQ